VTGVIIKMCLKKRMLYIYNIYIHYSYFKSSGRYTYGTAQTCSRNQFNKFCQATLYLKRKFLIVSVSLGYCVRKLCVIQVARYSRNAIAKENVIQQNVTERKMKFYVTRNFTIVYFVRTKMLSAVLNII